MYLLLKTLSYIFQLLPRKFSLAVGRSLGTIIYYFYPRRKSIAIKNLSIAFPDLDLNKKNSLLKSCYRHYGMVLVDFFRLPKVKKNKDKIIVKIPSESIDLFNNNQLFVFYNHLKKIAKLLQP